MWLALSLVASHKQAAADIVAGGVGIGVGAANLNYEFEIIQCYLCLYGVHVGEDFSYGRNQFFISMHNKNNMRTGERTHSLDNTV